MTTHILSILFAKKKYEKGYKMNNLKEIRSKRNYKQQDIANLLDISQEQYSEYEREIHVMKIGHYMTLALFYNVSIDYLCGLVKEPRKLEPE